MVLVHHCYMQCHMVLTDQERKASPLYRDESWLHHPPCSWECCPSCRTLDTQESLDIGRLPRILGTRSNEIPVWIWMLKRSCHSLTTVLNRHNVGHNDLDVQWFVANWIHLSPTSLHRKEDCSTTFHPVYILKSSLACTRSQYGMRVWDATGAHGHQQHKIIYKLKGINYYIAQ